MSRAVLRGNVQQADTAATMSSNAAHSRGKIFFPNLDGLRFFAFFLVYLQHGFFAAVPVTQDHGFLFQLRELIFNSGWAGVSFFFVLSGFLITYLILSEIKITGRIDVKAFYIRRALRIWPLYFLVLGFGFIIYPLMNWLLGFSTRVDAGSPLYYLFFLSNLDVIRLVREGRGEMFLGVTWSVAIEEQFYFVWPLLFFYLPVRFYKYIFPAIIFFSACFRFRYHNDVMVINFHSLSVISDMAVGGLAAHLSLNSERFRKAFANLPTRLILATYLLGLLVIVFREHLFVGRAMGALERLIITLFFVFIILEQNYSQHSFIKISALKLVSRLGVYTYGLYLLHAIAGIIVTTILKVSSGGSPTTGAELAIGLIGLLLSIVMSVASYHFFEKRFLSLKRRYTHVASAQTYP
jgi:peptidoglycan/LPS O-acetylase OafA/YrhL